MTTSKTIAGLLLALLGSSLLGSAPAFAEPLDSQRTADEVAGILAPVMAANDIPGMAVGVVKDGNTRIFNFGLASKKDGRPVDDRTIFEIGSISKTFTGTLGAYAAARGKLALSDKASRHRPELSGTPIGETSLLDLATYTAGGLPLQFPDEVRAGKETLAFFRAFRPTFRPRSERLYSNPSIGLFGDLAARSEGQSFERVMTDTILPKFGLSDTFVTVPKAEMDRYAFGTSRDGRPVRVTPGPLDGEAYGIKTTAADLLRFVAIQMDPSGVDAPMRRAIAATQTGYYRFGATLQGLGWEIYDDPKDVKILTEGNSPKVALEPQGVAKLDPPEAPKPDRFVNKTGSTAGFGAYAAFLPEKRLGIVILANRSYPNPQRVEAAWKIMEALE